MAEPLLERAVASVADRLAVDWTALEREADSDDDRALIDCLRILGGVGNLHRTMGLDTADSDRTTTEVSPPHDSQVPISSKWGRFRIDAQVGEGGFGRVFRAWDPDLEREIAIKILHRRIADARMREALLREGRALAKIHHPHVVNVLGMEARGDEIGLCMEFVHGSTLEDTLRDSGRLDPRDVARIGADLCRALEAVHRAGFVHRDIKARNVMRDHEGRVVLMDFGAGQQSQPLSLTGPGAIVGTPLYMAPEVLAGQPATPASDIYSLGVLLYRLVTAEYPVEGQSVEAIRAAHMQGRRRTLNERRPELPALFVKVVDRALTPDPARRYESATQCLEALLNVLDDRTRPVRMTMTRLLVASVLIPAATIVGLAVLGAVISKEFNSVLGRNEFAAETFRDSVAWGAASFVMPGVITLLSLSVIGLLFVLRYIALRAASRARSADAKIIGSMRRLAAQLRLDDPQTCACVCLLAASLALGVGWWWFQDLIGALFSNISHVSRDGLALLSPAREAHHLNYRLAFTAITAFAALTVFVIARLIPRPSDLFQRFLWLGSFAVLALSLFYLAMPYRILRFARFPEVRWQNERCFSLGERQDGTLLFCPERAVPRTVIAPKTGAPPVPTGVTANIFAGL